MNKIILIGRWTEQPELRYTPNGTAVMKCTIAVKRDRKVEGQPEADFITIIAWQKLAEAVAKHTDKGFQVAVTGKFQIRSYDDSQGIRRKAAEVIADGIEFLGKPKGQQNNGGGNGDDGFMSEIDYSNDDLPF